MGHGRSIADLWVYHPGVGGNHAYTEFVLFRLHMNDSEARLVDSKSDEAEEKYETEVGSRAHCTQEGV